MVTLNIRRERPDDENAVGELLRAAFDGDDEALLVAGLRTSGEPWIALVAERESELVGHIVFTEVDVDGGEPAARVAGLAPMAVAPALQRHGIGSQLVEAGIAQCWVEQYDAIVVLGHPNYYPRFGFQPASRFGISCAWPVPDDVFMALELTPGALAESSGQVHYLPQFGTP